MRMNALEGHGLVSLQLPRLESRLESICQKGCRLVWKDIARLERGEDLPETRGLSPTERGWLLMELKAVMAVYGERCSVD